MPDSCAKLLADNELTVVFIESATAGYLSHRFSVSPYSGDVTPAVKSVQLNLGDFSYAA
ncbi:hypothetical protein [Psychrobacter sp. CCUG 69069]|uniref:hypothetical protein n=1 Tax=Psychrobacter sp. CCUG 69069 TaxID=2282777 RepID=UPI001E3FEAE3|nr:hypothetical protein [Psychrobacter sp. CCUG 69069]